MRVSEWYQIFQIILSRGLSFDERCFKVSGFPVLRIRIISLQYNTSSPFSPPSDVGLFLDFPRFTYTFQGKSLQTSSRKSRKRKFKSLIENCISPKTTSEKSIGRLSQKLTRDPKHGYFSIFAEFSGRDESLGFAVWR